MQAVQFGLKVARHLASISGAQDRKIALPRTKRGPFPNTLGKQQRLNAVLNAQPLLDQALAFTVNALGIFLIWCRHTYHAAALAIPPKIGRKYAKHAYGIEPIRFGSFSRRCSQNPSRPASKQQTTPIATLSRRATRSRSDEMRASKPTVLPPSIRCRCGLFHPD